MPRRVAVLTGTRAEFGLLKPLLDRLEASPDYDLQVLVTGMHLEPRFGGTVAEIRAGGYSGVREVPFALPDDRPETIAQGMGQALAGMADAFRDQRPELLILLGDRFELLAAASAAVVFGVPMAHIHGGEVTEGAFDDQIRHAMTKLAHLHFVAAEPYAERVRQMGEADERVFTVGGLGVESMRRLTLLDRVATEEAVGLPFGERMALVTFHPETAGGEDGRAQVQEVIAALDASDLQVVITMPNADPGGDAIRSQWEAAVAARPGRWVAHESLGQLRYFSVMAQASVVVGNSSSGLLEAPSFGVPTVNIGSRQTGRLRAESVLDCPAKAVEIVAAIQSALGRGVRPTANPYGDGHASEKIMAVLDACNFSTLNPKPFVDREVKA